MDPNNRPDKKTYVVTVTMEVESRKEIQDALSMTEWQLLSGTKNQPSIAKVVTSIAIKEKS